MKQKKVVSLFLIVCLMLSLMTGCGNSNNGPVVLADEYHQVWLDASAFMCLKTMIRIPVNLHISAWLRTRWRPHGTLNFAMAAIWTRWDSMMQAAMATGWLPGMSMLRLASASIDRTLQTEEMEQMDEMGKTFSPKDHGIEFRDVHFSYENKEILHGINVKLPDKTTTAVIGPSGSGKTTLCNLIARFWDVDSGSVKIGGRDVREFTLESLMDQISMVFQNVYLFADTIENNIKFGMPDATHAQVAEAARRPLS